jgi:hypothetical protein
MIDVFVNASDFSEKWNPLFGPVRESFSRARRRSEPASRFGH